MPFSASAVRGRRSSGRLPDYERGRTVDQGLAYRNCSRGVSRLVDAICGRSAYVAYEPGGKQTLAWRNSSA
jgi:hypothetical protein